MQLKWSLGKFLELYWFKWINLHKSTNLIKLFNGPQDELGEILSDPMQKRRYQQKLTVFIVGYQEICGQRKHVLDQLQEFFSFYCKVNKEDGDLNRLEESSVDMDGVVDQVTGALKSAEMAMCRLADIHSEIVNYVNQTLSTCSSRKRKISDDKNRKKLEKAVEQARGNIVTLTNQLLRAQEDLTSKDQQMKEMLRQHEMRLVEIRHFKGQLEDTKINLQTLQEETAKQRSLLEAEMRIQAGRLAELESQVTIKLNQYRHASSQWEIQELISYTCRATQTPDEDEEKSVVQKTEPVPPNDKEIHWKTMNDNGESQVSITKPSTVDSNITEAERVSLSEMEASLTMSKQNVPNIISSLMSELITSLPLNEESESICTSLPAYQDGRSIMTAQGDSEETKSFTTEELLPNKTNHPDGPATMPYTFSNQVSHLNASFSLPEENTENIISLPEQEKTFATCDTESFIGTQTMTSHLMFDNTANADTTPRIGSNEKNSPLTSLPVPQINACPPESDVENGKIKVPEIDPIPHHSVPLPAPENNTISVASDGNVYFAKSLSILEVDTNNFLSQPLEDLTFHASQQFEEINCMNPALSSCADTKTDSLSITQHGALEEREENILNSQWDLQAEGGQQTLSDVTGLRGDPQTELLETSYRFHMCLQTIRNVLITGGK
ncbi:uncharacterized protein LOC128664487 [Bombina bombina]|uniref:uncharacterized protein LOC128664487 n=1 Tax=Bombina bombina TaxID=8345 RepID=UPI00235B04B2|nr:uncharacterized protein LOC128664487 [Bombina bombina]